MVRSLLVVGTGLVGTSVALAARRAGTTVFLADHDATAVRVAEALGAGVAGTPPGPVDLALIAVPPAQVGPVLRDVQRHRSAHSYTDVAGVKGEPERDVLRLARIRPRTSAGIRWPAGSGPARWPPRPTCSPARPGCSPRPRAPAPRPWRAPPRWPRSAARCRCGLASGAHDALVALTSHVPHLMAALTAARLREGPAGTETLTGQGVRDVTRVAAGDPTLWTDVVRSNAPAVAAVLRDVHDDLTLLLATVEALATPTPAAAPDHRAEAARAVTGLLARGVDGASRIRPPSAGARLRVDLDHGPGGLRRLLHDAAPYGVAPDRTGTALDRDGNLVVHLEVPAAALVAAAAGLATAGWPVTPVGANRA